MDIGARVIFFRELAGLSGAALADKIGLDQSQISKIETNKSYPSLKALIKICEALNVSLGRFFGDDLDSLPPDIHHLINKAKTLTPAQLKALDNFLATLGTGDQSQIVKEEKADYRSDLDALLPRDEINLAEALVKISEIVYLNSLTEQDVTYLHKKAVEYYGVPVPKGANIAAHGPKSPGQIKSKRNPWKKG